MSVIFWVRHGPTHQKNFVGWRDVPADLTATDQIARLSAFLPGDAAVVSSDLLRSIQTGDAIQGDRRRLPHMPGLREFHFGAWDGVHFSDVAKSDPKLSRQYWEEPGDHTPPGGESWNMAAYRVSASADHLIRRFAGRPLVIVAHIGVILTQVQRGLGCTGYEALGHKIDNLSVTQIDHTGATPDVRRINHIP